jgi:hypothetical protein
MKLLYVLLVLNGVVTGKTNTDATAYQYPTMDKCVWAAKKISEETTWYDGSHYDKWSYCVPIYGYGND